MAIKDLNTSLFLKGRGPIDPKLNFSNEGELQSMLNANAEFFNDGDFAWLRDKKVFVNITLVTATPRTLSYEGAVVGKTMHYDAQESIFEYLVNANPAFSPTNSGYKDGDGLVVGIFTPAQILAGYAGQINEWDVYTVGSGTYNYTGSLLGTDGVSGVDGKDGKDGERGDPFTVDAQGPIADRPNYCAMDEGFSFFATDTSLIYFKTADGACTWTVGTPFGQGKVGATVFQVYMYAMAQPSGVADDVINIPAGWADGPGQAAIDAGVVPGDGRELWMTKATYRANTDFSLISGEPSFSWSDPVQISGVDGLDGKEGIAAGFWAVWNNEKNPSFTNIPKPIKDPAGLDSWVANPANPDWYDDVAPGDAPQWAAMILYDTTNKVWKEWAFSQVAGEQPSFIISLYKRSGVVPVKPTQPVPYKTFGKPTTAANVEGDGWMASPPAVSGTDKLYMSTVSVESTGATAMDWSNAVQIDGEEGQKAGYFMVWSDVEAMPSVPEDPNVCITDDQIDLTNSLGWYDDVTVTIPEWSATSYWKYDGTIWKWSDWKLSKTKGKDGVNGDKGDPFTLDAQGVEADKGLYCSENKGFAFFATDTSLVYFKTDAGACTWTVGAPFGQGKVGATVFNVYKYSATKPAQIGNALVNVPFGWADDPGQAAIDAGATQGDGKELWMSKTSYRSNVDFSLVLGEPIFSWSDPVQVSGADGIDGKEGVSAGFWAIWSDEENPSFLNIPDPDKAGDGTDSWTPLSTNTDWYDDVTAMSDPKWTATILYDTSAPGWRDWAFSKVSGEKPTFMLTLYKRSAAAPAKPTASVPYKTSGSLTGSVDVEHDGWKAGPPPVSGNDKLYMSTISVDAAGTSGLLWSAAVQIDGDEGEAAGYFMVWSDASYEPILPPDPNGIIVDDQIGLDPAEDWYDDVTSTQPLWSATSYWKYDGAVWKWSNWKLAKLKGDDGADGSPGMPGGTIVMVNSNFNLGSYPEPRHPTYWGKELDPSISAEYLQNAMPPTGNTWKADSTSQDAVYLAIMTFGFNGTNSEWSTWRITRIKGLDAGWDQVNDLEVIGNSMFTIDVGWTAPEGLVPDNYLITLGGVTKTITGLSASFSGLTAGSVYAIVIKAVKDAKVYTPSSIIGETAIIKTAIKITDTAGTSSCTDALHTKYIKGPFLSPPTGAQIYSNSACTTKWSTIIGNHVIEDGAQKVKRFVSSAGVIGDSAGLCPIPF